jgi:hypothetical protein
MEDQTKRNIYKRGQLKSNITKLYNGMTEEYLKAASREAKLLRKEKLESYFFQYEEICAEIMDDEDQTPVQENYYETMERINISLESTVKKELKQEPATEQTLMTAEQAPATGQTIMTARVKLPDVKIPEFSGKYSDYSTFMELFTALIDCDSSLANIQKLFYLRNFTSGEAHDIIKNLPVTGDSYVEAVKLLKNRYDNKFLIISELIQDLLDIPHIKRFASDPIRCFISRAKQTIAALKNLKQPVEKWDMFLVILLCRKLDSTTSRMFYLETGNEEKSSLDALFLFLESRATALEETAKTRNAPHDATSTSRGAFMSQLQSRGCISCGKHNHRIYKCNKFLLLNVEERIIFVNDNKLCVICLNSHQGKCKFNYSCKKCKKMHNTLLHKESAGEAVSLISGIQNNVTQTILPTAKVRLHKKDGTSITVRALLDSASQVSFMSSHLAKILGHKTKNTHIKVVGIAQNEKNLSKTMFLKIFSLVNSFSTKIKCFILEKICDKMPQYEISTANIPPNIKLADDDFYKPQEIHLLLGSDVFFQLLCPKADMMEDLGAAERYGLIPTTLGWVVGGAIQTKSELTHQAISFFCGECDTGIGKILKQFWETEAVPQILPEIDNEQAHCEQMFKQSVCLKNGRFSVKIPLKTNLNEIHELLGDSLFLAKNRFLNLERKFTKNKELFLEYKKFIDEYVALKHAKYVDICDYNLNADPVYFLPHHAVIRKDAITTKLRVVFDASMKTSKGVSLNDLMYNGPVVQNELSDILLLFRLHKYVVTCDIRHMYRNINIDKNQRSLQNILWRDNPEEEIKCIQLKTVTYGLKSSSFLATRCLKELADIYKNIYPLAAHAINNFTYVDDVLISADSEETIKETICQLIEILSKGSFNLHKWSTNNPELMCSIPRGDWHFDEVSWQKGEFNLKTLGLNFNIKCDTFRFKMPLYNQSVETKREILSFIGKFYDPLGLIGPIFVQAKLIMQAIWIAKIGWDSPLPSDLQSQWKEFHNNLIQMEPIDVKRNPCVTKVTSYNLVGFADASNKAYGCCLYLRTINIDGTVTMVLLSSKSRVNPIKNRLSIPRLELNAALLLAKLYIKVKNTLESSIKIDNTFLFSDSLVVLSWIKNPTVRLEAYIFNRANLIKQNTSIQSWSYVDTKENPADCLSRGMNPSELQNHQLWWQGPGFLKIFDYEQCQKIDMPNQPLEYGSLICSAPPESNNHFFDFIYKYSDLSRMQRVLSYVLRFCNNI